MTGVEMFLAILRVAGLALVFGAGIPVLYALGMRAQVGKPIRDENGVVVDDTKPKTHLRVLGYATYVVLALIISAAILWVAKDTLAFYLNWKPFGDL